MTSVTTITHTVYAQWYYLSFSHCLIVPIPVQNPANNSACLSHFMYFVGVVQLCADSHAFTSDGTNFAPRLSSQLPGSFNLASFQYHITYTIIFRP